MELNLNRLDYCQVSTTAPKCMHILSASGRKDPLQKVLYSSTLLWVHLHLDFLYFKIEDKGIIYLAYFFYNKVIMFIFVGWWVVLASFRVHPPGCY